MAETVLVAEDVEAGSGAEAGDNLDVIEETSAYDVMLMQQSSY